MVLEQEEAKGHRDDPLHHASEGGNKGMHQLNGLDQRLKDDGYIPFHLLLQKEMGKLHTNTLNVNHTSLTHDCLMK